jgi:hypothetical protein
MFTICKQFIKINDELFFLKKTYEESRVKNVDAVKDWLGADIVFRKDNNLYFCEKIQQLETIN